MGVFSWPGVVLFAASCAPLAAASGAEKTFTLNVSAGDQPRQNVVVKTLIALPADLADAKTAVVRDPSGETLVGQLGAPGVLTSAKAIEVGRLAELVFVAPRLEANQTVAYKAVVSSDSASASPSFVWKHEGDKWAELSRGDQPVLRYMREAVDNSTAERRGETFKVYHHVYDPAGKRFVTKGPGGLFPHHRGLFYGFNRVTHGDNKKADVWHCRAGESQTHEKFLLEEAGPVLGRHRAAIAWRGVDGQPFAHEERELTAYHTPGGLLIEFASRLRTAGGKVRLDGDPQHAGFQFRASQDVPDKTAKLTYYLRPDGKGEPGKFRNWPGDKTHANLPWNALSFVLDDTRYTCCYLDHPNNPKEARFSERDYGRFGSYFEYDLTSETPLDLNYRVWLQAGEMSVAEVSRLADDFTNPPTVKQAE